MKQSDDNTCNRQHFLHAVDLHDLKLGQGHTYVLVHDLRLVQVTHMSWYSDFMCIFLTCNIKRAVDSYM